MRLRFVLPVAMSGVFAAPALAGTYTVKDEAPATSTACRWRSTRCIGSDGSPGSPVNGVDTPFVLPEQLAVSDFVIGQPATVAGQGFANSSVALLFFAMDVDPRFLIRQGAWMLELPWVYIDTIPTDGAGNFMLQTTIPDDPSLVALLFLLQSGDATTISEPEELIFSD